MNRKKKKWMLVFLVLAVFGLAGIIGLNAAERFPWVDEPYSGDPGSLRKIDTQLLNLDGGNQDNLSARTVSFLDREVGPESPHVPYARPYYKGKVRVLYLTAFSWGGDPRVIIDLQQRLDADIKRFRIPDVPGTQQLADIMLPRYLKMLESDYDVIIYASDYAKADERYLKPLLAKVEKGAGLVYIQQSSPRQNESNFKIMSPVLTLVDKKANGTGKQTVVCQDHPAVNGIPFDLMQYTQYARNTAAPGAQAVASIGDDAIVAVGQYGKGRLAGISYSDELYFSRPEISGIYYRHWEYLFALQARCVLWAANREPNTKVKLSLPQTAGFGTPLEALISIQGDKNPLKGCDLKVTFYDDEHQLADEKTVRLEGAGLQKVICSKPLRSGQVLVDARIINRKGEAIDWASGGTIIKVPGEATLSINPDRFQEGQSVTMSVTGWKPEKSWVHFKVIDSYQRLVFDRTTSEGTATWKTSQAKGTLFRVVAETENENGDVMLRQRGIATCPKYGIDDYYTLLWPGPYATYNADLVMALYRECGIDGLYNAPWDKTGWYAGTANNMKNMGGNLVNLFAWGNVLKNPLLSDAVRTEIKKERGYEDSLKLVRQFGMVWGSLQDEGALGVEGYGFDDFTLDAFRKELQGRYPNVEALNKQWDTNFTDWTQVKPAKFEEMKGRTNYGQWLEFRKFMDQRAAQQMGELLAGFREAAGTPDVPVGVEGIFGFTVQHVPFGLTDYGFLTRAGLSLAPYNGPECYQEGGGQSSDSDLDSFLNSQPAPAAWCGYSDPEWKQRFYPWYGAFHGYAGTAYFEGAVFTSSAGAKYPAPTRWLESAEPLRHGVGKLLLNSKRHFDPVAIYFDMGNFQLAWIVARTQDKGWLERLVADGKASTERMLQDLSVTPGYVTPESIADGALKGYKVVILDGAFRLSGATLKSLKEFAENGGVIIADGLTGMYDETGKPTGPDYIKDLLGVTRKEARIKLLPNQYSLGVLKPSQLFPSLPFEWMKGTLFEEGLEADSGAAVGGHVEISQAPGFIEKRLGKGRTMLINAVNTTYFQDADERDLKVWQALMNESGIKPEVRVCSEGMPLNCYDVNLFKGEGVTLAGIIRSPRFGAVNPLEADVTFEQEGELYDVINGKYLGKGKSARMELLPAKPALVAQVGQKVTGVKVKADAKVKRGDLLTLDITVNPAGSFDTVLRMEVFRPDGELDEALTGNLTAQAGRYAGVLPLALNDPKGTWKIKVREVVSHATTQATFRLQ